MYLVLKWGSSELFILFMLICLLIYLYVYVGVVHAYNGMHVEVKEQALKVHSLILPYGSQSLNSGRQVWQQVSLPSGQSYQACFISFIIVSMGGTHVPEHTCRGQRTAWWNRFFSHIEDSGVQTWSPGPLCKYLYQLSHFA